MDQITLDVWSVAVIILLIGSDQSHHGIISGLRSLHVYSRIRHTVFFILEYLLILYVANSMFGELFAEENEPVIFSLTIVSFAMALLVWEHLQISKKRWLCMGLTFIAFVFLFAWLMHVFFDLNAIAAVGVIWKKFFLRIIIAIKLKILFLLKFSKGLWKGAIKFVVGMTWGKARSIVGRLTVNVGWRWVKKISFFLIIYQVAANRARRLFMNEKMQKLKTIAMTKKDVAVAMYKRQSFGRKFTFCMVATVSTFVLGESWDLFYPFLPKGIVLKLIGLVKFLGSGITLSIKKLGLNGFIDGITSGIVKLISIKSSNLIKKRWYLFQKWRIGRLVIMIDRWITVVNRPMRKRARAMRQAIIDRHKVAMTKITNAKYAIGIHTNHILTSKISTK